MWKLKKFVSDFNEKKQATVQYLEALCTSGIFPKVHGLEDEPEGGRSLQGLPNYRLDKTAEGGRTWF